MNNVNRTFTLRQSRNALWLVSQLGLALALAGLALLGTSSSRASTPAWVAGIIKVEPSGLGRLILSVEDNVPTELKVDKGLSFDQRDWSARHRHSTGTKWLLRKFRNYSDARIGRLEYVEIPGGIKVVGLEIPRRPRRSRDRYATQFWRKSLSLRLDFGWPALGDPVGRHSGCESGRNQTIEEKARRRAAALASAQQAVQAESSQFAGNLSRPPTSFWSFCPFMKRSIFALVFNSATVVSLLSSEGEGARGAVRTPCP